MQHQLLLTWFWTPGSSRLGMTLSHRLMNVVFIQSVYYLLGFDEKSLHLSVTQSYDDKMTKKSRCFNDVCFYLTSGQSVGQFFKIKTLKIIVLKAMHPNGTTQASFSKPCEALTCVCVCVCLVVRSVDRCGRFIKSYHGIFLLYMTSNKNCFSPKRLTDASVLLSSVQVFRFREEEM